MAECPACGAEVNTRDVFDAEQCSECETPLAALVERAQTEVDA